MSTAVIPAELVASVGDLRRRTVVAVKQGTARVVLLALRYRVGNLFLALLLAASLVGMTGSSSRRGA